MAQTAAGAQIKVWDPFVRLFHWGVVALVAAAFLTQDSHALHIPVGYAVLVLVGLRVVWGFVGTRHARFADFVTGPRSVVDYLQSLRTGHPRRYLGHNPAGGAMVIGLILLLLATAGTGWLSTTDMFFGNDLVSGLHSGLASVLVAVAGVHVLGVVASSFLHRENLVRAMLTGRKPADLPGETEHEDGPAPGARLYPR